MKRLAIVLILFLTFSSCSFDNKSGIWKDASNLKSIFMSYDIYTTTTPISNKF